VGKEKGLSFAFFNTIKRNRDARRRDRWRRKGVGGRKASATRREKRVWGSGDIKSYERRDALAAGVAGTGGTGIGVILGEADF